MKMDLSVSNKPECASRKTLLERRPLLSDGFQCQSPGSVGNDPTASLKWDSSISSLRFNEQEDLLVDDILYCMQGIAGQHIRLDLSESPAIKLEINPHFDESIRVLAGRILPLCIDYHHTVRFVEHTTVSNAVGAVRQALGSAIRSIMDEYNMYVAQLDQCQSKEGLTLQKLWYHIQPIEHVLKLLSDCCITIQQHNIFGGNLLTFLYLKSEEFAGDRKAQGIFTFLLEAAAKPFFAQLERWLCYGELIGKKEEFMITFNENARQRQVSGTAFDEVKDWECRYSIMPSMCPSFLSSAAEKILNSGKYLNIISSCGCNASLPVGTKLRFSAHDRRYLKTIDTIYADAGRALVSLLIDEYELTKRLQSLKYYFLIGRGDWLMQFMEAAEKELNSAVEGIVRHRIKNLLAVSFNLSSVAHDSLKDEISFEFLPHSITGVVLEIVRIKGGLEPVYRVEGGKSEPDPLRGFDAFGLQYDAPWPLSIVFHKDAMFKYQIIFRQLFTFKSIERQLSKAWLSRRGNSNEAVLLHTLATFARKFLHHASVDVIEPYWHRFMESITSQRVHRDTRSLFTLDDLLKEHNQFLDSCTAGLLLTEEPLVLCVEKIVELCKETIKHVDQRTDSMDVEFMHQEYAATVEELLIQMRSLSNSRREKGWLDVAYSLGLLTV